MSIPSWHERCTLREDVRNGRLELFEFAADLNLVRQGHAPPIYQQPQDFFSRTYPSGQMKLLVRQVARRLSDLPDGKPVIRMQVAYGGGKTHTLIALLHLAEQGAKLHNHPTVGTFLTFADVSQLPRARVALLPFDKFNFQEGLTVYDAEGNSRAAYTPWGILAFQLGGAPGYAMVNDNPQEYSAPGEDRLAELLALPQKRDGSGTLILIDETLMYCRDAYNARASTLGTLKDFFQRLTQAIGRTPKCAMVASLVSSETEKHDATGIIILRELENIFGRVEENIEPVGRDDLPEVLRRRFFEQIPSEDERQAIANSLSAALQNIPVRDSQKDQQAEHRFRDSYPFHPELLDVLTQKWTLLSKFQRTRGALRLLGLALKEAAGHDPSPLIAPGAFLSYRGEPAALSPALAELVKATDDGESWRPILEGEAARARIAQGQYPALHHREIEQAVIATFLHSQPRGKRAETPDLLGLLAYSGVDQISLTEGLKGWRGLSWFLVEGDDHFWQLDLTPNLNQMHAAAMDRVKSSDIEDEIHKRASNAKTLTERPNDIPVHVLPRSPRDVEDDRNKPELRYLVLGPECAVTPDQSVSAEVNAFFSTTSGPNNPRTYKNALVALAPDSASLSGLRNQIKRALAWQLVQKSDDAARLSEPQQKKLQKELQDAERLIPGSVQATWSVLVAADDEGKIKAELLKSIPDKQNAAPFERIIHTLRERERLAPEKIDPDLLLPDSYFNLWRAGQTELKVIDLARSFGQFTRLPRLLRRRVLDESLRQGAQSGALVLRLVRSDGSARTIWRQTPSEEDLHREELEIVPLKHATLTSLDPALLAPSALPDLWPATPTGGLTPAQINAYFDGRLAPRLDSPQTLDQALRAAVKEGVLMLQSSGESYYHESLPPDLALNVALMLPPPPVFKGSDLGPASLSDAWTGGSTTIGRLSEALTAKHGVSVPWPALRDALIEGERQKIFSLDTSLLLTAAPAERAAIPVHPRQVDRLDTGVFIDVAVTGLIQKGQATLLDIKPIIEQRLGAPVPEKVFITAAQQAASEGKITLPEGFEKLSSDDLLKLRVQPKKTRIAVEARLNLKALTDLPQAAQEIRNSFPDMNFEFRVTISAEGEALSPEQVEQLNAILGGVSPQLRLS